MSAVDTCIAAIGSGRIAAIYHRSAGVATSGSNLTGWDDYRGNTGFGPTLLPNGGAGGTAPTVDANYVITDGSASFIRQATALAATAINNTTPATLVLWGELIGAPSFWPLAIDSDAGAQLALIQRSGSITKFFGASDTAPKLLPASGVRSLFIISKPSHYGMVSADPGGSSGNVWMYEPVGRAPLIEPLSNTATTGFISLGKYSTAFGAMRVRGFLWLADALLAADRAAIEVMVADETLSDNVDLYRQADSKGLILCLGDSLTFGTQSSAPSVTVPVDPTGTGYPPTLQKLINAQSLKIDVINRGTPSIAGVECCTVLSGQTHTYADHLAAMCSPARRAAGYREVVIIRLGANDVSGSNTAALESALAAGVASFQAAGARVGICTIIPLGGWFGTSSETERLAVNSWMLGGGSGADLVFDLSQVFDAGGGVFPYRDPSGGSDTVTTNTTYYNADGIHSTDLSYGLTGTYIFNQLFAAGLLSNALTQPATIAPPMRPTAKGLSGRVAMIMRALRPATPISVTSTPVSTASGSSWESVGGVAQTTAAPDENMGRVASTTTVADENVQRASGSSTAPHENAQRATTATSAPDENLGRIATTLAAPDENLGRIATPAASADESVAPASSVSTSPDENVQRAAAASIASDETLGRAAATGVTADENLGRIAGSGVAPWEALGLTVTAISNSLVVAMEWLGRVAGSRSASDESLSRASLASASAGESLARAIAASSAADEHLSAVNQSAVAPIEQLGGVRAAITSPASWLGRVAATIASAWEALFNPAAIPPLVDGPLELAFDDAGSDLTFDDAGTQLAFYDNDGDTLMSTARIYQGEVKTLPMQFLGALPPGSAPSAPRPPQDLTGATLTFSAWNPHTPATLLIDGADLVAVDRPNGKVSYRIQAADDATPGSYIAEAKAVWPDGTIAKAQGVLIIDRSST